MGSLGSDTNISDITYQNVYTWSSNQMYMCVVRRAANLLETIS